MRMLRTLGARQVLLSPIWPEFGRTGRGGRHYHVIDHGLRSRDLSEPDLTLASLPAARAADGLVARLPSDDGLLSRVRAFRDAFPGTHAILAQAAGEDPSARGPDEDGCAAAAEFALRAATAFPDVRIWFDTFQDVDRGYFVWTGLVDRRYALRKGARRLAAVVDPYAPGAGSD